jgi:imidazolonepropionase
MPQPVSASRSDGAPDRLFVGARLATLAPARPGLGLVDDGAVLVRDGRIAFAGPRAELPASASAGAELVDCEGRWITPGLVDCHTHLVHAGNRAREFEMRLAGATYEEVARAGGGIVSSVAALRAADDATLLRETLQRLDALLAEGVTTVEVKSGYGLDLANERKALAVARRLGEARPVTVRTTFLGAHALPPERRDDRDRYVAEVADIMLPALAADGLVDAVDGF